MIGIHGVVSSRPLYNKKLLNKILFNETRNRLINCQTFSKGLLAKISLDKFGGEKVFYKFEGCLTSIDGIILNLKRLLIDNKTENLGSLIIQLYNKDPFSFLLNLKGSFQGFIYLEAENRLIIFTDHLGSRPLFYFYDDAENMFIFSSSFPKLVNMMHAMGFQPKLNEEASYCLLTFGHMLGDITLVDNVKRIPPGSILTYHDGDIYLNRYYELTSYPLISESEDEITYELFKRISKAVYLEYIKDLEYNYRHLALLSGGLDSRTDVALAKKYGFSNITCITYSQSKYLDQKIASKICRDNEFEHLFFPLEYGDHLIKYINDIINVNGGLVYYIGICNLYPFLKKLNLRDYGLLHTGILGGEIFGEYSTSWRGYNSLRYFIHGMLSGGLLSKISKLLNKELLKYKTIELFKFYNIGVNAQLTNLHIINQFIDTASPFLYLDLLEYAMRLPREYKLNKKIYTRMINQYLPEFAWYVWEHSKVPPKIGLHNLRIYNFILSLIDRGISRLTPLYGMNPFDYYYKKNKFLRNGFYKIFSKNISLLKDHMNLMENCTILFSKGNFSEKAAVITLLKAVEILGL